MEQEHLHTYLHREHSEHNKELTQINDQTAETNISKWRNKRILKKILTKGKEIKHRKEN